MRLLSPEERIIVGICIVGSVIFIAAQVVAYCVLKGAP
jgi:hypothetical protein